MATLLHPDSSPEPPDRPDIPSVSAVPPTKNSGRGWVDKHAAEQTDREHLRHLVLRVALLLFITTGDVVMIKSTRDRVLRLHPVFSWVLSICLSVLAVALMWRAGACARKGAATAERAEYRRAGELFAVWLVVGAGLCWLRWHAAQFAPSTTSFEGSAASHSDQSRREQLLALVLLALYLATGALSWIDGRSLTNPIARAMRAARRRVKQLASQVAAGKARVARLVDHRDIHIHELMTVDARRDEAIASVKSIGAELKELVRVQIAAHLGDPRYSGLVHEPPRSRNGRAADPAAEQR